MMLVGPRVLAKMKESNTHQPPPVKVVTDLDTQMNEALACIDLSTREKVKLRHQILQRYIERLSGKRDTGWGYKTIQKMKSFSTLLRATFLWVGTILVSLFARTEWSPRATSKT